MPGSLHLLEIVGSFLSFALLVNNSPSPTECTFEWGEVCYHSLRSGIITSSHYHAPCLLSSVPYQRSFFTSTQNELWKATPHTCSMKINSPYSGGPMSSAKLKLYTPQWPRPHPLGDFLFPEYAKLVPFSVTPNSVSVPGKSLHHHFHTSADFFFFRNCFQSHPCSVPWPHHLETFATAPALHYALFLLSACPYLSVFRREQQCSFL